MNSKVNFHDRFSFGLHRLFWCWALCLLSHSIWELKWLKNFTLAPCWSLGKNGYNIFFSACLLAKMNLLQQRSALGRGTQTKQAWTWEEFHNLVSFAEVIYSIMTNLSLSPTNLYSAITKSLLQVRYSTYYNRTPSKDYTAMLFSCLNSCMDNSRILKTNSCTTSLEVTFV